MFRPFVGVGYQSSFSNEKLGNGADTDIRFKDAKGVIGTVGVDMNINSTWFARADARYMRARPDVKVGGEDRRSQDGSVDRRLRHRRPLLIQAAPASRM